jgi:hypothetical protein
MRTIVGALSADQSYGIVPYLYGITSECKLVEELQMHLAWRWFTGLSFDQEIPHQSTFSKNRHGRFQESNLFCSSLSTSWTVAWKPDSSRASTYPWMAASLQRMPAD